MVRTRRIDDLLNQAQESMTLRAKSLIVTVYGDAILHHGGSVWLGSLINLVAPFGLSERMVRTAVFRLTKDDWLSANQIGRRSYYGVTEIARRRFETAHRRIYAPPRRPWNGEWSMIHTSGSELPPGVKEALKRELMWLGFGSIAPNVLAHPSADEDAVRQLLQDFNATDQVVSMKAMGDRTTSPEALRALVAGCWDLDKLEFGYNEFLDRFRPLWRLLESGDELDPQACFLVRILLIHDYRRILLRDPLLPEEVLPPDWPGAASRLLCRNLYRLTQGPAEQHLMQVLETAEGPLPEASPLFYERFGGLVGSSASKHPPTQLKPRLIS